MNDNTHRTAPPPAVATGAAAGNELVTIVDERDITIGVERRRTMRAENLRHRATYIFVFDAADRLLLQQRTMTKDLYPGLLDAAAGGVVTRAETYRESAEREIAEELGLSGIALHECFGSYFEDAHTRCFGRAYWCRSQGPFRLQAEEVARVQFESLPTVLNELTGRITPDSLAALRVLLANPASSPASRRQEQPTTGPGGRNRRRR